LKRHDQVRFRGTLQHPLGLLIKTAFDGVVLLKYCKQGWHRRIRVHQLLSGWLCDLGSTSTTLHNGVRLTTTPVKLRSGDVVFNVTPEGLRITFDSFPFAIGPLSVTLPRKKIESLVRPEVFAAFDG